MPVDILRAHRSPRQAPFTRQQISIADHVHSITCRKIERYAALLGCGIEQFEHLASNFVQVEIAKSGVRWRVSICVIRRSDEKLLRISSSSVIILPLGLNQSFGGC